MSTSLSQTQEVKRLLLLQGARLWLGTFVTGPRMQPWQMKLP